MNAPIRSRIWSEQADPRSPFLGREVRICGFDYYGELLGRADPVDMLWLLFCGEAPDPAHKRLLCDLAVLLADPGPREASVHAAMCGGIGGSRPGASLMAALAVADGDAGGRGELLRALRAFGRAEGELAAALAAEADACGTWPGFTAASPHASDGVLQALAALCRSPLAEALHQLATLVADIDGQRGAGPLAVAAAAFHDLGLDAPRAGALFLLLRLPGALAHALEQHGRRHMDFPFFSLAGEAPR